MTRVTRYELVDGNGQRITLWRDEKGDAALMLVEESGPCFTSYCRTGTGYQWINQGAVYNEVLREFREWMEDEYYEEANVT